MDNSTVVLYHDSCADGFTAAWVANRYLGDRADYIPVQYGQEPPDVSGKMVYILDFSYKRPAMEKIIESAGGIVVLDHHKTAKTELDGLIVEDIGRIIRFDMSKSGARLACEYFFPNEPSSWLVDFTEDRDLWLWKLRDSRAVNAALASYPWTFKLWDDFHDMSVFAKNDPNHVGRPPILERLADEGSAIIRYQDQIVDSVCCNAVEINLGGYKVLSVNATCLISEICGKIAIDRPFGASYFIGSDGRKVWSLRSRDGGIDVSEIAKRFGGGGHAAAAGFIE